VRRYAYLIDPRLPLNGEHFRLYFQGTFRGAQTALNGAGCELLLQHADPDTASLDRLMGGIDGVFVHDDIPRDALERLAQRMPVVLIGWWLADGRHDAVSIDNETSICRVVNWLYDQGHRRIAFVGYQNMSWHHAGRWRGYLQSMQTHGLTAYTDPCLFPMPVRNVREETQLLAREMVGQLLRLSQPPTALVCPADAWAIPVMQAALERGLHVPRDLSVIGFDFTPECTKLTPALSSVRQPHEAIGRQAAELMLARKKNRNRPTERVLFSGTLVLLESTGPAPAS